MAFPEIARGSGPIVESAEFLLHDGFFEVLEVGPVNNPAEQRALRKLVKSRRAAIAIACQPTLLGRKLDLNSLDSTLRVTAVAAVKEAIGLAQNLGAEGIGLVSGPCVPEAMRSRAVAALAESLNEICAAAGQLPVHLEVFDFDVDKKRLIGPTRDAAELARLVRRRSPNFGLMLDSSHFPLQHERMRDALAAGLAETTHIHAGNCVIGDKTHPLYGDTHPRFGISGGENGPAQLSDFLSELIRAGYLRKGAPRIVTIEVKPAPGETSEELVTDTKRAWRQAWENTESRISG